MAPVQNTMLWKNKRKIKQKKPSKRESSDHIQKNNSGKMTILDLVISDFKIEPELEKKLRKQVNDQNNIVEIDFALSVLQNPEDKGK